MISSFSPKQYRVMTWWHSSSEDRHRDGIICDGAVRSGKTLCMSLSFVLWAMSAFDETSFAICGKTVTSLRRNVITPLLPYLRELSFGVNEKRSQSVIEITAEGRTNRFYLFGGKDESSQALIQGITLGGILLDEVALMPQSFVSQAVARCSIDGSRLWFNCNPEHPLHWFNSEWIKKSEEKNCLYLHFTMEDNPSLSPEIAARYRNLYSGVFYERFIEGKWVATEGLVYPFFDKKLHLGFAKDCERYVVSCDYGTVNPMSMGLWGLSDGVWYRVEEFYHDSKKEKCQKTDEEYYACLEELVGERSIEKVIVDPSAVSFIECIRRHGRFNVVKAKNDVCDGIRRCSEALKHGKIKIAAHCRDIIREFSLYRWEDNSSRDVPRKEHDHAMDDMRYFVSTLLYAEQESAFFVFAGEREGGDWR